MRTISLVNRYKWSFTGNLNPHALAIGDVDNDGDNEFIIGNLNGDLAVFKGKCADEMPTFSCKDLGTITCVAVGDVRNNGKNSLICISAEGSAHIFDFCSPLNELAATATPSMTPAAALAAQEQAHQKRRRGSIDTSTNTFLSNRISGKEREKSTGKSAWDKPSLTLKVPVNVNKILIADIDGDGLNELVLSRTDRILHIYQLTSGLFTSSPSSSNPSTAVPTPAPSSRSTIHTQSESLVSPSPSRSASSRSGAPISSQNTTSSDLREPRPSSPILSIPNVSQGSLHLRPSQSSINTGPSEHLVVKPTLLDKGNWIFTGQITSLAVTRHPESHEPLLLVGQPGNAFIIIDKNGTWLDHDLTPHDGRTVGNSEMGYQQFGDLASTEGSTWQVATELATGKRGGANPESPDIIAILSMDGTLTMYDLKTLSLTQHELHVTHKLFNVTAISLSKTDILSGNQPAFGSMLPDVLEESQTHDFDDNSQKAPFQDETESISMSTDESKNINTLEKDNKSESYVRDDLFVVCAWNGTTYLVDWDAARWKREQAQIGRGRHAGRSVGTMVEEKRPAEEDGDEHLRMVKFEFEERVCAFAAGQYAVKPGQNVPCLFYVDFDDQVFVYWDIRLSLRPVLGFLDTVGEAVLDEVVLAEKYLNKGLVDENGHEIQQDLPDFVHKCMYDFDGLKAQLKEAAVKLKQVRMSPMETTETADTPAVINDNVDLFEVLEVDKTETEAESILSEDHGRPKIKGSVNNASTANKKGKKRKKKKH